MPNVVESKKEPVLKDIIAFCPKAEAAFAAATSEVYSQLATEIEAKGLECLAETIDFVRNWKAPTAG